MFLVGGAGNGKSYLSARVVQDAGAERIEDNEKTDGYSQRSYNYATPSGRCLRVVNDATIPAERISKGDLIEDITFAIEGGNHLIACVNRGVLLGELREFSGREARGVNAVAHRITSLLFQAGTTQEPEVEGWSIHGERQLASDHDAYSLTSIDGMEFDVIVVYMDHLSLLEPLPIVDSAQTNNEARHIALVHEGGAGFDRRDAAFEKPLRELAEKFLEENGDDWPGGDLDPVRANASMLSNEEVVDAWCRSARSAEIIGGFNFSYRDLWGLAALALVGPIGTDGLDGIGAWVKRTKEDFQSASSSLERGRALVSLASLRTHVLLYGGLRAGVPIGAQFRRTVFAQNDAFDAIIASDPLLDFSSEKHELLASAMGQAHDGTGAVRLFLSIDDRLKSVWSPLEEALDKVVAELANPINSGHSELARDELLPWYSQYLRRFHGLVLGRSAFVDVISELQRCMRRGLRGEGLSRGVSDALLRVFLPPTQGSSGSLARLPLMRPRVTTPATGDAHVAVEVDPRDFKLDLSVFGGRMILRIHRPGSGDYAETPLDFHLMREALSRTDGLGFSDSLRFVEPRLERLRARLVSLETRAARQLGGNTVFVGTDGQVIRPG
ncbi:hypothetical protein [Roseibium album]|uniref:hypothetical protein n=1 Tax=Roseibium album TaxID=311410 RepID=UPI0011876C4B|nr:hypothetical protein [Roseibium album]